MDLVRGCANCVSCANAGDGPSEKGPLNLKLCSWAEEEVSFDGNDWPGGFEIGFWGKVTSPQGGSEEPRAALFDPGSLAPMWGASGRGKSARRRQLLDDYVLDSELLGRGSYGEVIGATHIRTGARRAVKFVGKEGLQRYVRDASAFVRREVDILRRVDHPNVVRMYEAYEDDSSIIIVLEICDGGDLLERVTVARDRMPETAAAGIVVQMLSAVQHLWTRGIVHRDLKPENFLFARREPEREPLPPAAAPLKLIDFGLSRRLDAEAGRRMTPKIGTTEYMAPEALAGRIRPALADRMDVWSLGVVLHVVFIGYFPSPRLAELTMEDYLGMPCWKIISPSARDLLGSLLTADPTRRPSVMAALQHPWLAAAAPASSEGTGRLARRLPRAIQAHSQALDLRRVALATMSREVDECGLLYLRQIFSALEVACGGALTRAALLRAAPTIPAPISEVASGLERVFDTADADGSGSIDWSEFIAVAVEALPAMPDEACFRAFDMLGRGGSQVTAATLAEFFGFGGSDSDREFTPSGGTGASFDDGGCVDACLSRNSQELRRIVLEVGDSGAVDAHTFAELVRGE